jgi:flagellin-like protein
MNLTTILIAALVVALLGTVPAWPHSRSWGYVPSGIVGAILAILIILVLVHPA